MSNPARDRRVEDPTNLWLIDPAARRLVPLAVHLRISANAISIAGVAMGAVAAIAYTRWQQPALAVIGLLISVAWLVMDSLDGMVARATDTCSAFGRELDGLCDHGVFALLYLALASSVGGIATWLLMLTAGSAHALQANLYEAERGRFHRRLEGGPPVASNRASQNPATRFYDWVAARFGSASAPLDHQLAISPMRYELRASYNRAAVPVLRLMLPLSQNMRLIALFVACILGQMTMFFWFEIGPLSILTAMGIWLHRRAEARLLRDM